MLDSRLRIATTAALLLMILWNGSSGAEDAAETGRDHPSRDRLSEDRTVKIWEEALVLPTYEVAPPDLNPRFYTGRVYQGAMASFYPYPVYDRLTDVRRTETYTAVYLENEYIKLCVLPEVGGRIFSALDKTNGYDFFYRQHVIKPALIGMLGAWISGGVEWNVPHHHRASSFLPVDHVIERHPDGSGTLWVGETEWRHRMRWIVGITLRPGRSTVGLTVKIFNRTPVAHSFLFWINPAVHANDDYQVIFPPSTEFAVQHGKPEFARWPVADGKYAGVDYSGVDISWWKNHPKPVSFFAHQSTEDFFGGYDHGKDAGVLHVANHHVVPGKKFFEWGKGAQGDLWDKILTETDGPYLELMAGAYSDNQPDYSWCQPGEVKVFEHTWYPVRGLGGVKNATEEAAVYLAMGPDRTARVAANVTRPHPEVKVTLERHGEQIFHEVVSIAPDAPFRRTVPLPDGADETELRLSLRTPDGNDLLSYRPTNREPSPIPKSVERPRAPADIQTSEALYLTGLRVEQLYSPAADPEPYYDEAIRRDPGDYRANTALGLRRLKQGRYEEAEARLRVAIERVTENYIRPKDGEALYYLGVALRAQGRTEDAQDAFWRSVWSQAWKAAGYQALAEIACTRGDLSSALDLADRALESEHGSVESWNLRAALLRKLGRTVEATVSVREALNHDPLNFQAMYELLRLGLDAEKEALVRSWIHVFLGEPHSVTEDGDAEGGVVEGGDVEGGDAEGGDAEGGDPSPLAGFGASLESVLRQWAEVHVDETLRRMESALRTLMRGDPQIYLEVAVEYANWGFWPDAVAILERAAAECRVDGRTHPMVHYWLGYCMGRQGDTAQALRHYRTAAALPVDYCFPFRFESVGVLREASSKNSEDARAPYYLGNLLYDHQPEPAIEAWEEAVRRDETLALAHRNLGLAYARFQNNLDKAIASLERAIELRPDDPRQYYELDVLYEDANTPLETRLEWFERKPEVVAIRDDATVRRVLVLIRVARLSEAIEILTTRRFHNWEGRGEIHDIYVDALLERGRFHLRQERANEALKDFQSALEYPENLEVGKPYRDPRATEIQYWIARALESLGDEEGAKAAFASAVEVESRGAPDSLFCSALASRKLGREEEAAEAFGGLVARGRRELETQASIDYFAKFGDRESERSRQAKAHYAIGLGLDGQGKADDAIGEFQKTLELDVSHLGARSRLAELASQ